MPKFFIVRVRVSTSIVLAARVELQNDPIGDRENIAAVRRQLRRVAKTGSYAPFWESEPLITDPDMARAHALTLLVERGGPVLRGRRAVKALDRLVAQKKVRRG
jgi:hypothetical protein